MDWRMVLQRLPGDGGHRLGLPEPLAGVLSVGGRTPRQMDPRRLPQAWVEYRLLALLGITGWSLRWSLALAETESRGVSARNGTVKRAMDHLTRQGLWQSCTVRRGSRYVLVRLSQEGRTLLTEVGLAPVMDEWRTLETQHRGGGEGRQQGHTALVCAFTHYARRAGYQTQVAPQVDDPTAEPDVRLTRNGTPLYVEVQGRGGTGWRRAAKWQNLLRLQGEVALCVPTPQAARTAQAELNRCAIPHYRITDLQSLRKGEGGGGFWGLQSHE